MALAGRRGGPNLPARRYFTYRRYTMLTIIAQTVLSAPHTYLGAVFCCVAVPLTYVLARAGRY